MGNSFLDITARSHLRQIHHASWIELRFTDGRSGHILQVKPTNLDSKFFFFFFFSAPKSQLFSSYMPEDIMQVCRPDRFRIAEASSFSFTSNKIFEHCRLKTLSDFRRSQNILILLSKMAVKTESLFSVSLFKHFLILFQPI